MLLTYRDSQFWKKFQANHWQPRVPTVIRQPFKVFPFSEAAVLRAMKVFAEGLRGGDQRIRCLVSVGDSETAPRRPLKALFRQESESLMQLERNCAKTFSQKNFGLMVTRFEAVDPGIWSSLTAFLQDARGCIDFPVPLAFVDFFYGNYSSSFTGVHKDTQEIFAFVVRGEKRILAWPFDYFLSRVKGLSPGSRYLHMRLAVDPRKYRKDAIVLNAQPGDVIYWPSDYWHVSEPQRGRFSAMLSLGLVRSGVAPSFDGKNPERAAPRSQDMTAVVTDTEAARQLRWLTGFGFELGGPFAETLPRKRNEENVTVVKKTNILVLWYVDSHYRRILVASNGHSITLPQSSELLHLLEQIARGESITVSNSLRQGKSATFLETNWNKQCEFKTRKRVSKRSDAALLVDWLLRAYAVERS